jgi:type II secretory pathway pseudopilin PulG
MSARRLAHAHNPLSYLEIALVTVVLGVAAAVAVPEFFNLRQDANDDAAKTKLVQASRNLAAGAAVPAGVTVHAAGSSYCLETTVSGRIWHALRHAKPARGAC